jgi:hypothetical protein
MGGCHCHILSNKKFKKIILFENNHDHPKADPPDKFDLGWNPNIFVT